MKIRWSSREKKQSQVSRLQTKCDVKSLFLHIFWRCELQYILITFHCMLSLSVAKCSGSHKFAVQLDSDLFWQWWDTSIDVRQSGEESSTWTSKRLRLNEWRSEKSIELSKKKQTIRNKMHNKYTTHSSWNATNTQNPLSRCALLKWDPKHYQPKMENNLIPSCASPQTRTQGAQILIRLENPNWANEWFNQLCMENHLN